MKIKKQHVYAIAVIALVLVVAAFYFKFNLSKSKNIKETTGKNEQVSWMVDKNGYLYYPLKREQIKFQRINYNETDNLLLSKVIYPSTGTDVYGLLVLPKSTSKLLQGVVLLPGAGVSKESELKLAEKIAKLGMAVLTIDQRGVGENGGNFPSLDDDYASFLSSKEPYQHLMVYDALRAYDLLYSAPFVDPEMIIISGESLGGRIAIIAAALDRNIKGVLVISSSGFDFKGGPGKMKNAFVFSIDSDHYIDMVTPRKLVMIHNINDKNIPISSAINSYGLAQQPKKFIYVNDTSCNHGYCDSMYDGLVEGLKFVMS